MSEKLSEKIFGRGEQKPLGTKNRAEAVRLLEIKRHKITGISLHSCRYAWAEQAKNAGYPERFAQQALGHDSKTEAFLKERGVPLNYSGADLAADAATLNRILARS